MRQARDSFLMFLKDNLDPSIAIHAVRRESNNPNADLIQANALNIEFLDPEYDNQVANQPVSINVIHDDELTALDWSTQLWNLMSKRFYTPIFDYTNPATPVATGYVLFWNRKMKFRKVESPFYSHLNCRLSLSLHLT